jgi:hypothetical protein
VAKVSAKAITINLIIVSSKIFVLRHGESYFSGGREIGSA